MTAPSQMDHPSRYCSIPVAEPPISCARSPGVLGQSQVRRAGACRHSSSPEVTVLSQAERGPGMPCVTQCLSRDAIPAVCLPHPRISLLPESWCLYRGLPTAALCCWCRAGRSYKIILLSLEQLSRLPNFNTSIELQILFVYTMLIYNYLLPRPNNQVMPFHLTGTCQIN